MPFTHRKWPTAAIQGYRNLRFPSSQLHFAARTVRIWTTITRNWFDMLTAIFNGSFSISGWFFEAWADLVTYFNSMSTTQWGIVSACAVAFGFLCLKGTAINR